MLLCPARRPLLDIACAIQSGVILAHASVIVKGKTCRSHTFVESHSFYGSELEKQPSFCVFLFACQLFAHPFQNLPFAARYLYLGSTKDLCRFTLGFARIKAQADELPVGFIQSFQYFRQTDPFRQYFFRSIHRDIPFSCSVLIIRRGQGDNRHSSLNGYRHLLRRCPQVLCQLCHGWLCAGQLHQAFPFRCHF